MAEEHIRTSVQPTAVVAQPMTRPREDTTPQHKDSFREIVETIVFVIVLVLLLKTFIAEAFVIPTGSMAITLLGNHLDVTCPQCGHNFTVNASGDLDEQEGGPIVVKGCTCENCGYHIRKQEVEYMLGKTP